MLKYLKNNYVISVIILVSSLLVTFLYSLKSAQSSFWMNELFVIFSIAGMVFCESIFLLATDSIICRKIKIKERVFYIMKSLWISQCVLFPAILCLILINIFIDLNIFIINKIIVFVISYLSQLVLFFSYKFVTEYNWSTVIKIVASTLIITTILAALLKFI